MVVKDTYYIGIDIGTQGTKGVLCRYDGTVEADAFSPSQIFRPDAETVYEDPNVIFLSVISVIRSLTDQVGDAKENITAIGMDAQMAGIMGIDESFEAVIPLDSWLDSRCHRYTEQLQCEAGDAAIEKSGGQIIHSHASKILWWKEEHPEAYSRVKKFVMPNGYVAGKLCGLSANEAFMDYTFLHFNVFSDNRNCRFQKELLRDFGVDETKLPRVVAPTALVGTVCDSYAVSCGLPKGVAVIAGCGDTAASALGAGIVRSNLAYDVAGTASVFACATNQFAPDTTYKTLLFSRSVCDGIYMPLSYISGGGLCLEWLSRLTGKTLRELDEEVITTDKREAPYFLPHFSGRTVPLDNGVSGAFLGLRADCDSGLLHRAVMEAIAYEYKTYLNILRATSCVSDDMVAIGVGGGAKSTVFSQIKANVLGIDYEVPAQVDSAPVACALLASHGIGHRSESVADLFATKRQTVTRYHPDRALSAYYEPRVRRYQVLLDQYSHYTTGE